MKASPYQQDKSAAAFDLHAKLARQEKANPSLVEDQAFQRKRRRAYRQFLSLFSRGDA